MEFLRRRFGGKKPRDDVAASEDRPEEVRDELFTVLVGDEEVSVFGRGTVTPALTADDYLPGRPSVPVADNSVMLPSGHRVAVTGEGHYLAAFDAAFGPRRKQGARMGVEVVVTLHHEPTNPYDPNAIAVHLGGATCGYLPRTAIPAILPTIIALAAAGKVAACEAVITGGWDRGPDDQGSYGMTLSVAGPDRLAKVVAAATGGVS